MQIGIIGHRFLGDSEDFITICCHNILSNLKKKHQDLKAISALSEGADSIFAKCAISLNIPLESIVPFKDFADDFVTTEAWENYQVLKERTSSRTNLNFNKRDLLAYKRSMEWLTYQSDIIMAIWDGKQQGQIGGTWKTVELCQSLEKTIIHINPVHKQMNYYFRSKAGYKWFKDQTINQVIEKLHL